MFIIRPSIGAYNNYDVQCQALEVLQLGCEIFFLTTTILHVDIEIVVECDFFNVVICCAIFMTRIGATSRRLPDDYFACPAVAQYHDLEGLRDNHTFLELLDITYNSTGAMLGYFQWRRLERIWRHAQVS